MVLSKPGARRYLLKSSGKIQAKTPQEVKTTPSRNDLDLVKGLKRSGRALHAPKDRHTRQLPLEVAVDPRVGVVGAVAARKAIAIKRSKVYWRTPPSP